MLCVPIPIPYFNIAYDQDGSNKVTIITSNLGHSERDINLVSDKRTATTQFSTDVKN